MFGVPGATLVRAQTGASKRRIGMLLNDPARQQAGSPAAAFKEEMKRNGWTEGVNISYESRFSNGDFSRYVGLSRELVASKVDLIFAYGVPAARSAQEATSTIPIVFLAPDPVEYGLVKSLREPGGNPTGLTLAIAQLHGKRMQLLSQAAGGVKRLAYLGVGEEKAVAAVLAAAKMSGFDLIPVDALPDGRTLTLPGAISQGASASAWLVDDYAFFGPVRSQIMSLIATQRKPAMYTVPSWVREGGLLGYAQDDRALAGKAAALANRILRGAEPASLPVEEPTTFVFAVNLVTARSLGITIPSDVLLQATDVIQ